MNKGAPLIRQTPEPSRIGFFGKLPTHGDFVSWGFGPDLERRMQDWLQAGLQQVREVMGDGWDREFRAMQPWRFIVERNLWLPATLAGVLVPSLDRVGRSFPLIVLSQVPNFQAHPRQLYRDETWFTAAEGIAESSLRRDFDMAHFIETLKRLRSPRPQETPEAEVPALERPASDTLWWTVMPGDRRVTGFRHPGPPRSDDLLKLVQHAEPPEDRPEPRLAEPPARKVHDPAVPAAPVVNRPAPAPASSSHGYASHGYASHPGTRLSLNADALLASRATGVFAVADGVGDGANAAEAAKLAIHLLSEAPACDTLEALVQESKAKLGRAHSLLQSRKLSATNPSAAITSIVVLLMAEGRFAVQWAGDARLYLLRDGMMRCLTRDHLDIGLKRHVSRAIGMEGAFRCELLVDSIEAGDRFLLCSGPLLRALPERSIAETLMSEEASAAAKALIDNALIAGSRDNLTALVVTADSQSA
jgi:type VI secretion system protein ImpM